VQTIDATAPLREWKPDRILMGNNSTKVFELWWNSYMTRQTTLSPADILAEVVEPGLPGFSPAVDREIISLRFNDEVTEHIRDLLQRKKAGTITLPEKVTLDNYLRVGELLDLLQTKARQTFRQPAVPAS